MFGQKPDTIFIKSLSELAKYAAMDEVVVRLKAGNYEINDDSFTQNLKLQKYRNGEPSGYLPITAFVNFSGNNSQYYLDETLISIDTKLHRAFGSRKLFEVFVSGNSNYIQGLTVKDVGDDVPTNSAIMLQILGDNNVIREADLYIRGSSYGYGHLLGKGVNSLVSLHKHSSLLVSGKNTKLIGCKVVTHAYGHGIVMQGAVNTLIKDCYVEGKMRPTNEMLAKTSGLAYEVGFKSIYPPGKILLNQIKALSEDGVRTYPRGNLVSTKTEGVAVINTTVKNMRSGFDLAISLPPSRIIGCTAIGCQEKGYSVGNDGVIKDCKGDALYGPLLTFMGKDISNCEIELELMNDTSQYEVKRVAEINGYGHDITIRSYEDLKQLQDVPIVFGKSFWGDVHQFRNPDKPYSDFAGAMDIKLNNQTGMPIVFSEYSEDCVVLSNGKILEDRGHNNKAKLLTESIVRKTW